MNFVKYRLLTESPMSIGELFKDRIPNRIDVFVDKIEKGDPFTLAGTDRTVILDPAAMGDLVTILKSKDDAAIKARLKKGQNDAPVFIDTEGNAYKISQFEKTSDFGGGGGANAGSAQTAIQEVGQAVVLGVMTELGKGVLELSDLTPKNLQKGARHVDPSAVSQVQEIFQLINSDKAQSWGTTFVSSANALAAELDLKNKVFHRGSAWVTTLNNQFIALNKAMKPKPFSNVNKWTPADVWAVEGGATPPQCESLEELNAWLLEQFEAGKVYGISLKKTSANPTVHVYNADPVGDQIKATVKEMIISRNNKLEDLFRSKATRTAYQTEGVNIPLLAYYKLREGQEGEIHHRTFGTGNISSEIQGKHAAHGKIGFGGINKILRELIGKQITPWATIKSAVKTDKTAVIEKIVTMAEEILNSYMSPKDRKQLFTVANNSTAEALISKYQSVELVHHLVMARKRNKKVADKFITQILQAAGSQSPLSAVFVKVS